MRKFLLPILFFVFVVSAKAQNFTAQTYPMVVGTDALYTMTGSDTVIANGLDSFCTNILPIGFHFNYCGQIYDSFSISADGFIRLGQTAVIQTVNNLASGLNSPLIAAYWDDVTTGLDGNVSTLVTGTAPNRKLVVQWKVTVPKNINIVANAEVQLVLFERTGTIKIINSSIASNAANYSIGLTNYMNNTQQKVEVAVATNSIAYYNPTNVGGNTVAYAAQSYTFLPDSTKPAKPVKLRTHGGGANCVFLYWSDSSRQEVVFNVYRSADNISFQRVAGINSTTSTTVGKRYSFHDNGLLPNSTYYYRITANTMGGEPSDTLFTSVSTTATPLVGIKTIPDDYYTIAEAYEHIKCVGLGGAFVLELNNNYDTLSEIFPINIDGNYNYSATNTLTIRPAAAVTQPIIISAYPADSTAFVISHTDYFTIDGKAGGTGSLFMLQVRSIKSNQGSITITNQASHNTLQNLYLPVSLYNSTAKGLVNLLSKAGAPKGVCNNTISNCNFDSRFLYIPSLVYSRSDATASNDSNRIENCLIHDYKYFYGIFIDNNNSNTFISGNSFYHTKTTYKLADVYVVDTVGGDLNITNNYFGGSQPLAHGVADTCSPSGGVYPKTYGINIYASIHQTNSIQGNVLTNVTGENSNGWIGTEYIAISITGGNNKVGTVTGNLIGDTTARKIQFGRMKGILCNTVYADSVGIFEIANNTISGVIFREFFYAIQIGANNYLDASGQITANIHHNHIGSENFNRSIVFTGISPNEMVGIRINVARKKGPINITHNTLVHFGGCADNNGIGCTGYGCGIEIWGHRYAYSIDPNDALSFDTLKIINNTIKNSSCNGMNIIGRSGDYTMVSENKLSNLYGSTGIGVGGYGYPALGIINKNKVVSISTNIDNGGGRGIWSWGILKVINNLVSLGYDEGAGNTDSPDLIFDGITCKFDSTGSVVYNNSVFIEGSTPTSFSHSTCLIINGYLSPYPPSLVKNNIFYNTRIKTPVYYSGVSNAVYYYYTSPVKASQNIYYFNGRSTGLSDSAYVLQDDTTSLIVDPLFVKPTSNPDSIDLHLFTGSPAIGFCNANILVQDDLDNNPRMQTGKINAGCYQSLYEIPAISLPPVIAATGATSFCAGGSVLLSVPNQTGAFYQWKKGGVNVGVDTNIYVATVAGTYTVVVTNIYGSYTSSNNITVTINNSPAVPLITSSAPVPFCSGDSVTLTAPTSLTYRWSTNVTTQSIVVSTPGLIVVTVSNGYNCSVSSAIDTITLNLIPNPYITPPGSISICNGGSVTLSAYAGNLYHWSNNATTQTIAVNQPGVYNLTVTDAHGCSSISNAITVNHDTNTVATVSLSGSTSLCNGGNVTLFVTYGIAYHWSNNDSTYNTIVTQSGTYSVTVNLGYGCSAISANPVTVTVYPVPSANITTSNGIHYFCAGDTLILSVPPTASYHWSDGSFNQSILVTQSGSYRVTVTNSNNCSASASSTVIRNQLPVVTLTGNPDTVCNNAGLILVGGSPPGGTYSGSGIFGNYFNSTLVGLGIDTIVYTYTNSSNCTNNATETIFVDVCSGINDLTADLKFSIYPNPATDLLNITIDQTLLGAQLNIYNLTGALIKTTQLQTVNSQLQTANYPAGVYIAEVKMKDVVQRVRWVKM